MIEALEFLPLQIKKAALVGKGALRYRIIAQDGQSMVVDADSAAEALIKSGIANAAKIVNLDVEDNILGSELQKDGQTVPTSISHDEHGRARFFAAELPEHSSPRDGEGFTAFSLGDMAGLAQASVPVAEPAPAPATQPMDTPHVFVPPALPEEAVVAPEEPMIEEILPEPVALAVEAEILPPLNAAELSEVETAIPMAEPVERTAPSIQVPDRELTPEEIRKLLEE